MSGGNAPMSVPSPLSNVAFRVRGSVSNGSAESVSSCKLLLFSFFHVIIHVYVLMHMICSLVEYG